MGTVTKPNTFVNGTTANATEVNSNFDTLYTLVNGNIDNDNVKGAAGIVFSKLDSATVAGVDETQTLTNKTLTTPVITSIYQDAAKTKLMTLPDTASDTLAALDATQSLANKTLPSPVLSGTVTGTYTLGGTPTATSPTITGSPTAAGSTWADLGSVTTADINGGTIDGTPIGGTTPAAVTGTTGTFSGAVTAGAVSNVPLLVPGQVQNLSWTKAAGVITIAGADGTALSASNPAWVCVPSAVTAGTFVVLPITANVTFNDDDGASDFTSGGKTTYTFGVTSGIAWANAMPFTIYILNKDDTASALRLAISRNPTASNFDAADLGDSVTAPATPAQTNAFVFPAMGGGGAADYASKPAVPVGAGYMQKVGVAQDWTFYQDSRNGFGEFIRDRVYATSFTFPAGQNGASTAVANCYVNNTGGGTNPTFSTNTPTYTVGRDGYIGIDYYFTGNTATDGSATATPIYVYLPYVASTANTTYRITGYVATTGAGALDMPIIGGVVGSNSKVFMNTTSTGTSVQITNFQDGNRTLRIAGTYKAF